LALEENLLWYVAWRSADYELPPTKTRLVKYLYLVDLLASRAQRRHVTELRWIYYDYGPYFLAFEDLLQHEVERRHIRLERLPPRPGITGEPIVVRALQRPAPELVPAAFRTLADQVCSTWRDWELNVLLNHVYFETPPMRHAERGAELDLLVDLDESWPPVREPLEAPRIKQDTRARLAELQQYHNREQPRRHQAPPSWDDEYLKLLSSSTGESQDRLTGIRGLLHTDKDNAS